ncbi:MAG: DUF3445 domain-containing protein [Pseudomonadota bacterium]
MAAFGSFQAFSQSPAPFAIGLQPVDPASFIVLDDEIAQYDHEKRTLYETQFDTVFAAENGTLDSQNIVEQMIRSELERARPQRLSILRQEDKSLPPLARAALLVQDDLVLMRKQPAGWALVAASLCFPSSWSLSEKFGHPMHVIHGPVPMEQKMHDRIARIFDHLRPDTPLWRHNWSLEDNPRLRQEKNVHQIKAGAKIISGNKTLYYRSEYQTLHKLEATKDILFTIGVRMRPTDEMETTDAGRHVLDELARQISALSPEERRYKGLEDFATALPNALLERVRRYQQDIAS